MKPLIHFRKIIICITILTILIVRCENCVDNSKNIQIEKGEIQKVKTTAPTNIENESKPVEKSEESNYYSITLINTSDIKGIAWSDELSFDVIQIEYSPEEDGQFQNTVNETIKTAATSWIKGKVLKAYDVDLTITCFSPKYLSFINSFAYEGQVVDYIKDYVTIDMRTGKRIYLSDLIDINKEFVNFLQGDTYRIIEPPHPMWQSVSSLLDYSYSELLEELNKCSYTQEQWIKSDYYSISNSIGSLLFKNSFFLREGMLVITLEQGGEKYLSLDVDDLEPFLKVDKW